MLNILNIANGFKVVESKRAGKKRDIKVECLKDGYLITEYIYKGVDYKRTEKIYDNLYNIMKCNLNVDTSDKILKFPVLASAFKVVNGFKICVINQDDKKLLTVEYLVNMKSAGKYYYGPTDTETIDQIKERLCDNTKYNLTVEEQCRAISIKTMDIQIKNILNS